MKSLNEKIVNLSQYLQILSTPKFSSEVQAAVGKNDKNALAQVCKKAKIPSSYVHSVISAVLSVSPDYKWPWEY